MSIENKYKKYKVNFNYIKNDYREQNNIKLNNNKNSCSYKI
jgi:hypothetical protein